MSLTINTKTYTADAFGNNAVGYIGPAKTASVRDDVVLKRSQAKPTKVFSGVARALAKATRTVTLTGALTPSWDMIGNVELHVPAGTADADVDAICNDLASFVGSADFKSFVKKQKINF
jgi:hypothetical protein